MLQMLSLMQDGGAAVTQGPNRIIYPHRKEVNFCQVLGKMKTFEEIDKLEKEKLVSFDQLIGND